MHKPWWRHIHFKGPVFPAIFWCDMTYLYQGVEGVVARHGAINLWGGYDE